MEPTDSETNALYKDFFVNISPDRIGPALSELERQVEALNERIQNLIERFPINDMPIMGPLLGMVQDPNDLIRFAKGIERAGALLKMKQGLDKKLMALRTLQETPGWFIGELNDFTEDIDSILSSLDTGE